MNQCVSRNGLEREEGGGEGRLAAGLLPATLPEGWPVTAELTDTVMSARPMRAEGCYYLHTTQRQRKCRSEQSTRP